MTHHPEDSMTTNTSNTSAPSGLLPCPFCGSAASVQTQYAVDYWVQCDNERCGSSNGKTSNNRAFAIESWNRRAAIEQHVSATPERTGIESRKGIIEAVGAVVKSRGSYSAMGNLYRFINTWRDEQIATPAPARELTDSDIERIRLQVMDSAPVCEFAEYFARAIAAHIAGSQQ